MVINKYIDEIKEVKYITCNVEYTIRTLGDARSLNGTRLPSAIS